MKRNGRKIRILDRTLLRWAVTGLVFLGAVSYAHSSDQILSAMENITAQVPVVNPAKYWHGDGVRFQFKGLMAVPDGCGSMVKFSILLDETKSKVSRQFGTGISTYSYISGFTKRRATTGQVSKYVGFEIGIGNRLPMIVQNPARDGKYHSYYGFGELEGYHRVNVEGGFDRRGNLLTRIDQSYNMFASSSEEPHDFDVHHGYRFERLFLGIAYQNSSKPMLSDQDTYYAVMNSIGSQSLDCPGQKTQTFEIEFVPKSRVSAIDGVSEIHRVKRQDGKSDFVVIVASSKQARQKLLERAGSEP